MTGLAPSSFYRQPLVTAVIDSVRDLVSSQIWKINEKIPSESELIQLFAVSRNTVREAIRVLAHSGMLEVRQGDGTYVRKIIDLHTTIKHVDQGSLLEHFELRCMIEAEAAKYAALRRTDEDLRIMQHALRLRGQYDSSQDMALFIERDMAFHNAIVRASHNEAMCALYTYFSISIRNNTAHALFMRDFIEPDLYAHQDVFEAINKGDSELAESAVKNMIKPMVALLTKKFK
jgi:DNA-binding FadR family transcriptional regulator